MFTGSQLQRPLVAEHLHAVDQIADAVGFVADELGERAVLGRARSVQKLRRAANAGERVLDFMRQDRRHAGDRARRAPVGELALDHLRHAALLQHDDDMALIFRERRRRRHRRALAGGIRQAEIEGIFVDGGVGLANLRDQRQQRAGEGDEIVDLAAPQPIFADAEEHLGGKVHIDDAITGPQNQDRMRQRVEQDIGGVLVTAPPNGRDFYVLSCRCVPSCAHGLSQYCTQNKQMRYSAIR